MGVMVARRLLRFVVVLGASVAVLAFASASAFAASAPVVERVWASEVNRSTARLNALVNPSEADTSYRFEYGPDTSYGSRVPVPDGDLGSGSEAVKATQLLTGLQPGSVYHYRIVATSSAGTTEGEDETFSTFPAPVPQPADTCPNAAYRAGPSVGLPDCRAYEMVSPVVKNGADISGEAFGQTLASESGERVHFMSKTGFGELLGTGNAGYSQYIAERHPDGWVTKSITPLPSASNGGQVFGGKTEVMEFSPDLSIAGLIGFSLPDGPSTARPNSENLYLEDTTTGKLTSAITDASDEGEPVPYPPFYVKFLGQALTEQRFGQPILGGGSALLGVVTFMSRVNFTPEAHGFEYKAYVYENGAVKLLGVLPDGTVPPGGSTLVFGDGKGRGQASTAIADKDTVSTDGSRILFEANELPGQIFMRKDGTSSVLVSESEASEPTTAEGVELITATPDLRHIVFISTTSLLDNVPSGQGLNIYLYTDSPNPEVESNLQFIGSTDLESNFRAGWGDPVVGVSNDGKRVYFRRSDSKLKLWDSGQMHEVAPSSHYIHGLATTEDGKNIVFAADYTGLRELYVYKSDTDTLICVSCSSTGAAPKFGIEEKVTADSNGTSLHEPDRPRFMSSDGRYVFFNTSEALVPQDTNGVVDAYEYDTVTGLLSLLSTGTGEDPAWFVEASADGRDAFVVTRQKLSAGDPDKLVDVYDARVDGGLPGPSAAGVPCAGDACQGTPLAAPSFNVASGFVGLGNPTFTTAVKAKTRAKPNARLLRALAVCHRKPKRRRAGCERLARKRYSAGRLAGRNRRVGR
jgi:hypothetical protein